MVKREELISYTLYISKNKIPREIAEYIISFYYTWVFENKQELQKAIHEYDNGKYGDPNFWDVSNLKDMKFIFHCTEFNRDISNWDVSNVKDMKSMFSCGEFNGDISNWDVSNVENMEEMFYNSKFNGDISKWNINNVKNIKNMFRFSWKYWASLYGISKLFGK